MSLPFSRSVRALEADEARRPLLALAIAGALLFVWGLWFFLARVGVYEATSEARLEVASAPHPLEASVGGRVVAARMTLGARVEAGEVLVELEDEAERLALAEERARHATIEAEVVALERERRAIEAVRDALRRGRAPERAEAEARLAEARAAAQVAREEARRVSALYERKQVSAQEWQRAEGEAAQRIAAADAAGQVAASRGWDRRGDEHEREAEAEALSRELATRHGRLAESTAAIARLEHARAERQLRAPVAGLLEDVAPLRPGAAVRPGDRLATVVPDGRLAVIARFLPVALGRLAPGQRATVRLEGFTWTQYGVLHATVARVGGELREGRVRVELELDDAAAFPAPLRHGQPGTAEVEVERVSPARLLQRLAGRAIAGPSGDAAP